MLLQSASPTFHLRLDPQQIEGTAVEIEADTEEVYFGYGFMLQLR